MKFSICFKSRNTLNNSRDRSKTRRKRGLTQKVRHSLLFSCLWVLWEGWKLLIINCLSSFLWWIRIVPESIIASTDPMWAQWGNFLQAQTQVRIHMAQSANFSQLALGCSIWVYSRWSLMLIGGRRLWAWLEFDWEGFRGLKRKLFEEEYISPSQGLDSLKSSQIEQLAANKVGSFSSDTRKTMEN